MLKADGKLTFLIRNQAYLPFRDIASRQRAEGMPMWYSIAEVLLIMYAVSTAAFAFAGQTAGGSETIACGRYSVLTGKRGTPPPFQMVSFTSGPRQKVRGKLYLWWQVEAKASAQSPPLFSVRALTSSNPLDGSSTPIHFKRYMLHIPETGETYEYVNVHTRRALLPPWKNFQKDFIPRKAKGAGTQNGFPETASYLGHTLSLREVETQAQWNSWPEAKTLFLDPELLVGTGRNFRDAEGHRLPQLPQRTDYTYVLFTREDYRIMIDAGMNLFTVNPEQSTWIRSEPVFYIRSAGGSPPLSYPADLYRSNYLGSVMFMDEPAILMVGDPNIHRTLRYFSDAVNVLQQHIREDYKCAFDLENQLREAGVNLGDMRLEQYDFPAWETMYQTAYYQLSAGLAGFVHEGRYRLPEFDSAVAKWTDKPRKHSAEEMLRYHYAFLRGAARQTGKHWGTAIYGQADPQIAPLAVTLAYDMGARYIWFWTSDHDHHVPWPEQLALARTLKQHAAKHPRRSIFANRPILDKAVAVPYGWLIDLGDLWWVRALDQKLESPYAQRYLRIMRRFHTEVQKALDSGEEFDVVVDNGRSIRGYRSVVRINAD